MSLVRPLFAGVAALLFSAGLALSAAPARAAEPMATCPVPALDAIPGHEADFYVCAETRAELGAGCGPSGYLIGYGARYAKRFHMETRPRMSARGKLWIDEVLVCLQRTLRARVDETTSCTVIGERAFASHPGCYIASGFCSLPPLDLLQVVKTIDARDWWSTSAGRQAVETALGCGATWIAVVAWTLWGWAWA